MAIVKCLMMQRDESLLIEPWLRYYGYLFGFENLIVFDNGSVLPDVVQILRRYETVGVRVYWDFAGRHNFEGKSFHISNVIEGLDFGEDYDFAMPIDCDEFLGLLQVDGLECSRTAIHRELDRLIGEQRALGIEFSMFNVPGRPGCYRPQVYPKGFFARNTIKTLDRGYHYPVARTEGRRETELCYFHYHFKPFELMIHHARRKLEGQIDLDRPELTAGYTGPGNHLLQYLTMSEQQYFQQFDRSLIIRFDRFEHLLGMLGPLDVDLFSGQSGEDVPAHHGGRLEVRAATGPANSMDFVEFSASEYYRLNPDVAHHRIEALKHYFRHGFEEGRSIRSTGTSDIEWVA